MRHVLKFTAAAAIAVSLGSFEGKHFDTAAKVVVKIVFNMGSFRVYSTDDDK